MEAEDGCKYEGQKVDKQQEAGNVCVVLSSLGLCGLISRTDNDQLFDDKAGLALNVLVLGRTGTSRENR